MYFYKVETFASSKPRWFFILVHMVVLASGFLRRFMVRPPQDIINEKNVMFMMHIHNVNKGVIIKEISRVDANFLFLL